MPELPEVETILRGVVKALQGRRILNVTVRKDLRWPVPHDVQTRLRGRSFVRARRLGKYMLLAFEQAPFVLIHLGMSGRIRLTASSAASSTTAPKMAFDILTEYQAQLHEHVTLSLDDGSHFGLVDPRRFGCFLLVDEAELSTHKLLCQLGDDPLAANFTVLTLQQRLKRKQVCIKQALLDQKIVAGLGNIYVSEALFRARIHPARLASTLTLVELERLTVSIVKILKEAICAGGSTLRDYVDAQGQPGAFQKLHRVYGREGLPCGVRPAPEDCPGIRKIVQSGRATYYCPYVQRSSKTDHT